MTEAGKRQAERCGDVKRAALAVVVSAALACGAAVGCVGCGAGSEGAGSEGSSEAEDEVTYDDFDVTFSEDASSSEEFEEGFIKVEFDGGVLSYAVIERGECDGHAYYLVRCYNRTGAEIQYVSWEDFTADGKDGGLEVTELTDSHEQDGSDESFEMMFEFTNVENMEELTEVEGTIEVEICYDDESTEMTRRPVTYDVEVPEDERAIDDEPIDFVPIDEDDTVMAESLSTPTTIFDEDFGNVDGSSVEGEVSITLVERGDGGDNNGHPFYFAEVVNETGCELEVEVDGVSVDDKDIDACYVNGVFGREWDSAAETSEMMIELDAYYITREVLANVEGTVTVTVKDGNGGTSSSADFAL